MSGPQAEESRLTWTLAGDRRRDPRQRMFRWKVPWQASVDDADLDAASPIPVGALGRAAGVVHRQAVRVHGVGSRLRRWDARLQEVRHRRLWTAADGLAEALCAQGYADRDRYSLWPRLAEMFPPLSAPRGRVHFVVPPVSGEIMVSPIRRTQPEQPEPQPWPLTVPPDFFDQGPREGGE